MPEKQLTIVNGLARRALLIKIFILAIFTKINRNQDPTVINENYPIGITKIGFKNDNLYYYQLVVVSRRDPH